MKKFLFIIVLIFFTSFVFSQSSKEGYLSVTGKVKIEKDPVPGAFVKVYESSNLITEKRTDKLGKFKLKLPLNKEIILEVGAKGLVTKKIKFDTHVPETGFYWTYNFTVELFMDIEGLDVSVLNQPVTIVKYNKDYDEFEYDKSYTNLMKDKLKKLMDQLETLKKQKFNELIAKGDKLCSEGKYDEAIDTYEKAIDYDPYNYLPDNKIESCERRRSRGDKLEKEYKRLITNADALFEQKRYKDALSPYQKASNLKPEENYPKQKIEEINKLLVQQEQKQKQQELENEYNQYIASADRMFNSKKYEQAKENYNKALQLKPDEFYPKQKISEIDKILADLAAKQKLEQEYQSAIKEADALFGQKKYNEAKSKYTAASQLKPDESYPKQKISEIDKILADLAAKQKLEQEYQSAIKEADAAFKAKDYTKAQELYKTASGLKPDEQYPKDKLDEISKILTQLANENKYKKLKAEADKLYASKQFEEALDKYKAAHEIKPESQYINNRIKEIEEYLAELAKQKEAKQKREKAYNEAITQADGYFNKKDYTNALKFYKKAKSIKPNESYPKQQISKINGLLVQANTKPSNKDEEILKKLNSVDFNKKEEVKKYLSELARKYPEGKTVENYNLKNQKITRIIINHNGVANEYRKVEHSWGGVYYFKNGQSISKTVFIGETNK